MRNAIVAVFCLSVALAAGAGSRLRVLPFYEQRFGDPPAAGAPAPSFHALRPLCSRVRDDSGAEGVGDVDDVLWPLATFHSRNGASWWRVLNCYGDRRLRDDGSTLDYSFAFFPLWFQGRTREDVSYWGAFPFYGRHPHVAFMDDVTFALWPLYMDYSVKGVRTHSVCWPFVSWRDAPREAVGVWPFYGSSRRRESVHRYCLWPLFTWASYDPDRDTSGAGRSWMALPFYGRVDRERESQHLVLPPFFSRTETDAAVRWRLPWPLVDVELGRLRNRVSVWPFYESVTGFPFSSPDDSAAPAPEERTWRLGWKLVERTRLETERTLERRFSLFPFWTSETRWSRPYRTPGHAPSPVDRFESSYCRLWPFFARVNENGRTRLRVLELNPIRHSGGIERNWAPFWTFYTCESQPDGRNLHTLFWGIVKFHTDGK